MEQETPHHHRRQPDAQRPSGESVVEFLHNEFHFPAIDIYIERTLTRTGWLATLEQAGIVPVVANPNPIDVEQEKTAHVQWWDEHPDVLERYEQRLVERRTILKYLHIGAILGHLDGTHLYPSRDFPDAEKG